MPNLTQSTSSALTKLSREVTSLKKTVKRNAPEVKWSCVDLDANINDVLLFGVTESMFVAGDIDGIECRLLNWSLSLRIDTPGGITATDHVFYRVIVARSKVGGLAAGDFPTSVTACIDNDDKIIYHDKVYSTNAHCMNVSGPTYYGFNGIHMQKKRKYKSGLKVMRETALDNDNSLYVFIVASNVAAGATTGGSFTMFYNDA